MQWSLTDLGLLRPIRDDELELVRSWRNAPQVRMNMVTRHEISMQEHAEWWRKVRDSHDKVYFMYELAAVPAGVSAFTAIDRQNCNAFWGFYAGPGAPKGTGSRMAFLSLDYAFDVLGLRKLCTEVLAFNVASIKFHRKLGFQAEGILRNQHKVADDFVDIHRMGILREEWAGLRASLSDQIRAALPV
jgi:UDP-4-amino-4,6-dideoxy-N-acetyl-beta-L-altrosamine N-acetyltransferase